MEWEYRIVLSYESTGRPVFTLNTVWTLGDVIVSWDPEPEAFYADTLEDLRNDLRMALVDLENRPPLVRVGDRLLTLPPQ